MDDFVDDSGKTSTGTSLKHRQVSHTESHLVGAQSTASNRDSHVNESFVPVNGVGTHVITYGKKIGDDMTDVDHVILMIPGNPGIITYYREFMNVIHANTSGITVWGLGHAGHEKPPARMAYPDMRGNEYLFDVEGQIQHKIDFIQTHIPTNVRLTLIGHSIGAKIALEVVKRLSPDRRFSMNYMLFPTVERMKETPAGRRLWPVLQYLRWLLVFLSYFCTLLPNSLQRKYVEWYFRGKQVPDNCVEASLQLFDHKVIARILYMAYIELQTVCELDTAGLQEHVDKFVWYYGQNDSWCPKQYYYDVQTQIPGINAVLCKHNISHAFVLESSEKMGQTIAEWILGRQLE